MPNLTVVIPDSLANILKNAVARRATSPDNVVTAVLGQYFQTGRHRAYQISTSAALVQGASVGVHVDYRQSVKLFEQVYEGSIL